DEPIARDPAAVERHRDATLEPDLHHDTRGRLIRGPLEDVAGWLDPRILEHPGLDAAAPEVRIHGVRGGPGHRNLDAVAGGVVELLGPSHLPVTHRRYHAKLGGEGTDRDIETHL